MCENVSMVGFVSSHQVDNDVIAGVLRLYSVPTSPVVKFSRCLVGKTLYYSTSYSRTRKRNSSVVAYIDTSGYVNVGSVLYFISSGKCAFAVIQPFRVIASCQSFFGLPHSALDCAMARILPVTCDSTSRLCVFQ